MKTQIVIDTNPFRRKTTQRDKLQNTIQLISSLTAKRSNSDTLLVWMINRSGEGFYSCLHGNRLRYMSKYDVTAQQYRLALKKLIDNRIIKKIGGNGNGINPVYKIKKELIAIYKQKEGEVEILFKL